MSQSGTTGMDDEALKVSGLVQTEPLPTVGEGDYGTVVLSILDADNNTITNHATPELRSDGSQWLPFAFDLAIPEGAAGWRLDIAGICDYGSSANVFYDDLALRTGSLDADSEYLLITSDALAPSWQPLIDHREASGTSATMVTVEQIDAMYDGTRPDGGTDLQTKIRNCIADYWQNQGTQWVCLAGDETVIPVRSCITSLNGVDFRPDVPSDLYYADLEGTWDDNADGIYCEAVVDGANLSPEVHVGRIPVRTGEQAAGYIDKLKAYEAGPTDFANSMLLTGKTRGAWYATGQARGDDYLDHERVSGGETIAVGLYRNRIQPYWQGTPTDLLLDTNSSWDVEACGDYDLTYEHIVDRMNEGYHFVYIYTHGVNGLAWQMEQGNSLWPEYVETLTNGDRPSIVWGSACGPAGFEMNEPSLSEAFIRNTNGGAVAYIGSMRTSWGDSAASVFFEEVFRYGRPTLGEAFARYQARMASSPDVYNLSRWRAVVMSCQGDPALRFAGPESGRDLQMATPKGCELYDVGGRIDVRWNASGTGFAEDETVRLEYSSDSSANWHAVPGASELPFDDRLFRWADCPLPAGDQYRMRVVSNSDPNTWAASGRDFSIAPLALLTVRSDGTDDVWIDGTHGNMTDYTYTARLNGDVVLQARSQEGLNFGGWLDGVGNVLTFSTSLDITCTGDMELVATYEPVGVNRAYYVNDGIAENGFAVGNDDNDGLSPLTPVRHIREILDRYGDVETIHLSEGIFQENVLITSSDSDVAIQGAGAGLSIIDGAGVAECIEAVNAGTLTLTGLTLRNGSESYGAGLRLRGTSGEILSCEFLENDATRDGGAIHVDADSAELLVSDTLFEENSAGRNGGGIYSNGCASIDLTDVTLVDNTADNVGGGMWGNLGTVSIEGASRFERNEANDSAGLALYESVVTMSTGVTIAGNIATVHVGGVRMNDCIFALSDVTVTGNRAETGDVGGIHVGGAGNEGSVTSSTITDNIAAGRAGGLDLWNGEFTLTGNDILRNEAHDGAGLHAYNSHVDVLGGNAICDNVATRDVGGLYLNVVDGSVVDSTISRNTSGGKVGGLYFNVRDDMLPVTIRDNTVAGNTASSRGGGLDLWHGAFEVLSNVITGNAGGEGGGIYVRDCSTVTLTGNDIQQNTADGYGGGVNLWNVASIVIDDCDFVDNTSVTRDGGALAVRGETQGAMSSSILVGNRARNGGGLLVHDRSNWSISDCLIETNYVSGIGGGIYTAKRSKLLLEDSRLVRNTSVGRGGAAYLDSTDALVHQNLLMENVSEESNAGGMWLTWTPGIVKNNLFLDNRSLAQGTAMGGYAATVMLANNVFYVDPAAPGADTSLAHIRLDMCTAWNVVNCVFGSSSSSFDLDGRSQVHLYYSNTSDGAGAGENGNVSGTPLFVDPSDPLGTDGDWFTPDDGFRLQTGSPCIDAGHAAFVDADGTRSDIGLYGNMLSSGIVPTDIHVDASKEDGPWDGSSDHPYLRIWEALWAAGEGARIHVAAGTYDEHLGVTKQSIQLIGEGAGLTVLDGQDKGGQLQALHADGLEISGITFTHGYGAHGGAITLAETDAQIHDVHIVDNRGVRLAGGIMIRQYSDVEIRSSVIADNSYGNWYPQRGGGIIVESDASAQIVGNVIARNRIRGYGGGVYASGTVTIEDNILFGNDARDGGGGLALYGANVATRRNVLWANTSSKGGGIYLGSGFTGELVNMTIAGNTADAEGGGIYTEGRPTLHSSIVWGNDAPAGAGAHVVDEGNLAVSYSILQGGWVGASDCDPLFAIPVSQVAAYISAHAGEEAKATGNALRLRSTAGRWDVFASGGAGAWVVDPRTSPAVDGGHPDEPIGDEPEPHGGLINMGFDGGTATASKSPPFVVGRHLFYNHSNLDGDDASATPADDAAIAADKTALLAGETPTDDHAIGVSNGINGVMVDIAGLADPAGLTLSTIDSYFSFSAGSGGDPSGWAAAPAPIEVDVCTGHGEAGSDRVSIIWADGAITNQWLEVTTLAGSSTGLASDDVFYFAHKAGDVTGDGRVSEGDLGILAANWKTTASATPAEADFTGDGNVSEGDLGILAANWQQQLSDITWSPPSSGDPVPPSTMTIEPSATTVAPHANEPTAQGNASSTDPALLVEFAPATTGALLGRSADTPAVTPASVNTPADVDLPAAATDVGRYLARAHQRAGERTEAAHRPTDIPAGPAGGSHAALTIPCVLSDYAANDVLVNVLEEIIAG